MGDWSQVPNDIWQLVGEKLLVAADRIRFRCVCPAWRSLLPPPQTPWLILFPHQDGDNDNRSTSKFDFVRGYFGRLAWLFSSSYRKKKERKYLERIRTRDLTRRFFSLDGHQHQHQAVHQFDLPGLVCLGSMGTWLLLIDAAGGTSLFNPFSSHRIRLPPTDHQFLFRVKEDRREIAFRRIIASSCPISSPGTCIIMAYGTIGGFVFARPGDPSWTHVPFPAFADFDDIIFYKNQIYATANGKMYLVRNIDPNIDGCGPRNPRTVPFGEPIQPYLSFHPGTTYLVEWMGQVIHVIKVVDINDVTNKLYKCTSFQLHLFDFTSRKFRGLNSLGDYCLFLGRSTSASMLASDCPGLKRNCIYFTDGRVYGNRGEFGEFGLGHDMGVFDMEDGSVQLHAPTSRYSAPLWIIPSSLKF